MTEGANAASAQLAPSGPLGHLPRIAGEEHHRFSAKTRIASAKYSVKPGAIAS